jgi:hypothetical protein
MRFLITTIYLKDFTGSEINAFQLSQALMALGHSVDIATFNNGLPIEEKCKAIGVRVINLLKEEPGELVYDVIWAHHAPVLTHLLFKWKVSPARILFSCLGSLESLESPPLYFDEIPLFLGNSMAIRDRLIEYGLEKEKFYYFPNYALSSSFALCRRTWAEELKKVVVISNHPQPEVVDFAKIAEQHGLQVDFVGLIPPGKPAFVDEALLLKYDLVMTIGKTAPYCFALKIPFYCYDNFGGPGYITPENYQIAEDYNFSGRGFDRHLTGQEIFEQVCQEYHLGLASVDFLFKKGQERFCLENNLNKLLPRIEKLPVLDITGFRQRCKLYDRVNDAFVREFQYRVASYPEIVARDHQIQNISQEAERLKTDNAELTRKLHDQDRKIGEMQELILQKDFDYDYIVSSKAWRFARWLQKLRGKLVPEGSWQYKIVRFFYRSLKRKAV